MRPVPPKLKFSFQTCLIPYICFGKFVSHMNCVHYCIERITKTPEVYLQASCRKAKSRANPLAPWWSLEIAWRQFNKDQVVQSTECLTCNVLTKLKINIFSILRLSCGQPHHSSTKYILFPLYLLTIYFQQTKMKITVNANKDSSSGGAIFIVPVFSSQNYLS